MAPSQEEFITKYQDIIKKFSQTAENGECQIWGGCGIQKTKQYPIAQLTVILPGAEKPKKLNVARISKMIFENNLDIGSNLDASHLCHNSLCTRPDHINFEKRAVNNNRHICVSIRKCIHHEGHPDCLVHLKLRLTYYFINFIAENSFKKS